MLPRSTPKARGLPEFLGAPLRADQGVVAAVLAILPAAIIAMRALAVDLGRAWNLHHWPAGLSDHLHRRRPPANLTSGSRNGNRR